MRLYTKIYKNNKITDSATVSSENPELPKALLECFEETYRLLDLAEPLWLSGHTRDFSNFRRVKLYPGDFIEPVDFDYCEMVILD